MKYNILVTGCGGDIGQSLGKIINKSDYFLNIYGCDVSDENAGMFIYENFSIMTSCRSENYLEDLMGLIVKKNIDIVVPASEPELRFFSKTVISGTINRAKLITASETAMLIGFDKLRTANFLEDNKLPFPETQDIIMSGTPACFPVICKSRTGSGSSQVYVVEDEYELAFVKRKHQDFIMQEYLDGAAGEFTCGLFRSRNGIIRTIIMKRKLTGGFSGYGEVVSDLKVEKLLLDIANKMNLIGSINVQLRLTEKGPVVFEINPRFSSTVLFRHLLGFTDFIWSVEDAMGMNLSDNNGNYVGKKFYKGFNEYVL